MVTILKNNTRANELVDSFLERQWIDGRYTNVFYDDFRRKDEIKAILLEEQQSYCCYCMRALSSINTSLEHIIPQSANEAVFDSYIELGIDPINEANMMLASRFLTTPQERVTPPFPHDLAYHNLVASCDGKLASSSKSRCCNGYRGHKFVVPLFYQMNTGIEFLQDGLATHVDYDDPKIMDTFEHLGLNIGTLRDIRSVWFRLRVYEMEHIRRGSEDARHREVLLTEALSADGNTDRGQALITKFMKDEYWNTFLSYSWFHSYYRQHNGQE